MIKLGTSGFSFPDWIGNVYPAKIKKQDMLAYYDQDLGFDTLEVNFTYYRLPVPHTFEGMLRKTSENFEFVVKAHKEMTHDMIDRSTWTLRENKETFDQFIYGLQPLVSAKQLGCVLAQFPVFFSPKKENTEYIKEFKRRMGDIPLVVEFRNAAWLEEQTFESLKEQDIGYCTVDEPRLPKLVPFVPKATSDIGYFRFHGRNQNWFRASREERYNYRYTEDELKKFVPKIKEIESQTTKTYSFFNNCHNGQAVTNAKMMKKLLGLIEEFTPRQETLFGNE
jgi:uncharacterized protein YecE (DUF72 family)